MNAFDAKTAIKNVSSYSVTILCLLFVTWQSFKCISKYVNAPQGTKMNLKNTDETNQFPAITICKNSRSVPYDLDRLEDCGIR